MAILIREETAADAAGIHALNTLAFGSDAEARLVDALREGQALSLSLVALLDDELVGHIAFSPVVVDGPTQHFQGLGLAPMAVAPAHQKQGIGGQLMAKGIALLQAQKHPFCVVLGHPDYYPKHGFVPASMHQLRWEQGHDEAFFVRELCPQGLQGVEGVVRYRPEFNGL